MWSGLNLNCRTGSNAGISGTSECVGQDEDFIPVLLPRNPRQDASHCISSCRLLLSAEKTLPEKSKNGN